MGDDVTDSNTNLAKRTTEKTEKAVFKAYSVLFLVIFSFYTKEP